LIEENPRTEKGVENQSRPSSAGAKEGEGEGE